MSLCRKASILQSTRAQSDMLDENNSACNSKMMSRVESRDNSNDMLQNVHENNKKTSFIDTNIMGKESQKSSVHSNTADFQEQLLAQIYEASISQQTISQDFSNDDSNSDILEQNLRDLNFYYGIGKYIHTYILKTKKLLQDVLYFKLLFLPVFFFS